MGPPKADEPPSSREVSLARLHPCPSLPGRGPLARSSAADRRRRARIRAIALTLAPRAFSAASTSVSEKVALSECAVEHRQSPSLSVSPPHRRRAEDRRRHRHPVSIDARELSAARMNNPFCTMSRSALRGRAEAITGAVGGNVESFRSGRRGLPRTRPSRLFSIAAGDVELGDGAGDRGTAACPIQLGPDIDHCLVVVAEGEERFVDPPFDTDL